MLKYLFALGLFFFLGCSNHYAPLSTVKEVDINRYLGTWYEITRYEHYFERGCVDVSATYSLNADNAIDVLNKCELEDGTKKEANGVAYATDGSFSKLRVSFFRPFYGDYHILLLDKNYRYAVIGEPSREYFWILSRTKTLDDATLSMILHKMPSLGYDAKKLIWTKQK